MNEVFLVPVLRGSYLLSTHWSLISYIWLMLSYWRERSHLYVFHVMSYLLIVILLQHAVLTVHFQFEVMHPPLSPESIVSQAKHRGCCIATIVYSIEYRIYFVWFNLSKGAAFYCSVIDGVVQGCIVGLRLWLSKKINILKIYLFILHFIFCPRYTCFNWQCASSNMYFCIFSMFCVLTKCVTLIMFLCVFVKIYL